MARLIDLLHKRFHVKQFKGQLAIASLYMTSLLPLRWAQGLGAFVGRRIGAGQGKSMRITRKNVELCFPELNDAEREALARKSIEETGKMAFEMGMAWMWAPEKTLGKVKAVHNESVMTDALEQGRGVILIAPHLGNWEMIGLYVGKHFPLTAMYRPPRLEALDKLIRDQRERMGATLAPANVKGVRMAIKALRAGGVLGILPDQEADKGSGVFAPFFGVDAYTMKLLPQLAAQTGAVVVSAFAKRLGDGSGFEIYYHRADDAVNSKDLVESAAAMNAEVEHCVRQVPEQYQWEYKRFQRRPEGPKRY